MSERPLNVYHILLMHQGKGGRQIETYVAAETQKRAAELLGLQPSYLSQWGMGVGHDNIKKLLRSEPEQVFLSSKHGTFYRFDDWGDETKKIEVDVTDEELYGRKVEHPAFGMIATSRSSVGGEGANLFMVDYPQGHTIRLTISQATLNKRGARDNVFPEREIIVAEMSEVQWARMIASPNTSGVPCTLSRYIDPLTREYMTPRLPDRHIADTETFVDDVKKRGTKAMEGIAEARDKLAAILSGGALRKGELQEVLQLLDHAQMGVTRNLAYAVETAEEAIHTAVESAKAEVDAHVDFAMMKLGERALGDRLAQALEAGEDIAAIGRGVSALLDAPAADTES